jgi:hypothetical protein
MSTLERRIPEIRIFKSQFGGLRHFHSSIWDFFIRYGIFIRLLEIFLEEKMLKIKKAIQCFYQKQQGDFSTNSLLKKRPTHFTRGSLFQNTRRVGSV